MIQIIDKSDLSIWFYTLLDLSAKYDHLWEESQMSQILAKCLLKLTKKIQVNSENLNIERILLSLHHYLLKYSLNIQKFNQGKDYFSVINYFRRKRRK